MRLPLISAFARRLGKERRGTARARLALPIKLRTADFSDGEFVQIAKTLNTSRAGLYFPDAFDRYYTGMRLRFIVPYHAGSGAPDIEEIGEVIRVDRLANSPFGIAVQRPSVVRARQLPVQLRCTDRVATIGERRAQAR